MASAIALMIFYIRHLHRNSGAFFWLILSAACIYLSLDELLELHERGGAAINTDSIGGLESFYWNDVIVISYGLLAIGVTLIFSREILISRQFAALFALSFAFYVAHTAIDSLVPNSVGWKDVPEESAKLLSVFFLFLASCARFVLLIDHQSAVPVEQAENS